MAIENRPANLFVFKWKTGKISPVLTAPDNGRLPVNRRHPYEAQLDALEGVLCADLVGAATGHGPLTTREGLPERLAAYRRTLLEPVELPFITRAHALAAAGRAKELIALDNALLGDHPEWLQLAPGSTRFGRDYLARLRPLRDERVVQRVLEAARLNQMPGHHLTVFGLTIAVFSIAPRQGLADYAQAGLEAVVATAAGKLKLTQAEREALLAPSRATIPDAISRMVA